MATHFFRINDRGSLKRPTLVAISWWVILAIVEAVIFYDHPFLVMLIFWPASYILCALLFSAPIRVSLAKLMHFTRYPHIQAIPTRRKYERWKQANEAMLKKTRLKVFDGYPTEKK